MRWLVAVAAGRNGSGAARITFTMAERAADPSPRSSCGAAELNGRVSFSGAGQVAGLFFLDKP